MTSMTQETLSSEVASSSSLPPMNTTLSLEQSFHHHHHNNGDTSTTTNPSTRDNDTTVESHQQLMTPLMTTSTPLDAPLRSRKKTLPKKKKAKGPMAAAKNVLRFWGLDKCCSFATKEKQREVCRSITVVMNVLARITFWTSVVAMVACVIWYSYELKNNGTDPHLIAWFSAGAFVLLGFPISMYGIVMHLANYNQPNVQCYIVRILWMVPIYSMESWLCLRFHEVAIYIETLRDCYEAYVLYNFFQFLIQVLGGEQELVLMLKDKSPTRGVHMWGLQWCVRPWLMGQPVSRMQDNAAVHWTSPFFVKCKFGVLQYVLLKVVSSIFVMVLELHGLYKEGDFTPKGGYLYICILTNTSQCWALYCLIFFYYATKNELGPIRPVGKFLSVKALVFFTWWQSVGISMLYQAGMIPHYSSAQSAEWTSEDVAKGLQDYLICIEMFVGAIVHVFVFPHTDYLPEAVAARSMANRHSPPQRMLRLRRKMKKQRWDHYYDGYSKNSGGSNDLYGVGDLELASTSTTGQDADVHDLEERQQGEDSLFPTLLPKSYSEDYSASSSHNEDEEEGRFVNSSAEPPLPLTFESELPRKHGFVRALLDSTIPTDVMDSTVGIVKGDYNVERKTLLHHAATSDQYDLFRANKNRVFRGSTTPPRKNSKDFVVKSEKEQQ